jgi:enhancing lycopene biosynthesis protein 2
MKKFAVILAGCGVSDGAEIHEAVLTLLAIKQNGADYQCFAPDINQYHVINHMTGKDMHEIRNVLIEAARIARGNIKPLRDLSIRDFDALIMPGGFGVAKNLCTYAFDGVNCKVNPEVANVIREAISFHKPIGALCISPVILAKVLGAVKLTIGTDAGTAADIEKMGAQHKPATHGQVVVDERHLVFSTPCYMLDASITDIANGTYNIVKEMLKQMP